MPDELDPRDDAAVRRLLAQARHDEPVPDDVAARIDGVLAGLATEQVPDEGRHHHLASVVTMSRTRRNRAAALLVAAAAIVVVGIGVGQVVRPASVDSTSATDSGVAATQDRSDPVDREGTADDSTDDSAGGEASRGSSLAESAPQDVGPDAMAAAPRRGLQLIADPPTVREGRFLRDIRAVRRTLRERPVAENGSDQADFDCAPAAWGPGRTVAVLYDLAPAVLVLRPATRNTQVVDLVQCGTGSVLRSVTLTRG